MKPIVRRITALGLALLGVLSVPSTAVADAIFFETFADNSAGWTLDSTWQIGPATTSSGQQYGGPDPALDHTPTLDNGVAGVIIGGNAPTALSVPFRYLTSPVIDTAVTGSVFLEYYRWLNSDYSPYMQNQVQVWDGDSWVTLWVTGAFPGVQDSSWAPQTFDVTAYKNPNFQARFGYNITSGGVFRVSSWNLDDVTINAPDVTLIPEPETYALMLAGLGLLGFAMRRKNRALHPTTAA